MCHTPKIVRMGDTYVLYYIGSAVESPLSGRSLAPRILTKLSYQLLRVL